MIIQFFGYTDSVFYGCNCFVQPISSSPILRSLVTAGVRKIGI